MLKGLSPLLSPRLLACLCEMGHGDEILLADAHFPGHSIGREVIRADGLRITELLAAVLPLFELDNYVESPVVMMRAQDGDAVDPAVEERYRQAMRPFVRRSVGIERMDRFAFYDRARDAYAVVMTGEICKYGNILLKKGVVPCL